MTLLLYVFVDISLTESRIMLISKFLAQPRVILSNLLSLNQDRLKGKKSLSIYQVGYDPRSYERNLSYRLTRTGYPRIHLEIYLPFLQKSRGLAHRVSPPKYNSHSFRKAGVSSPRICVSTQKYTLHFLRKAGVYAHLVSEYPSWDTVSRWQHILQ